MSLAFTTIRPGQQGMVRNEFLSFQPMRLYTFQSLALYETLCRDRTIHSRPLNYKDSCLNNWSETFKFQVAYDWICNQMQQRGMVRPAPDVYPVWAYRQWYHPDRPRPDLRSTMARNVYGLERCAFMTLEIPDEEVLLTDYDWWVCCLNYSLIGNQHQSDAFDRRLRQAGLWAFASEPHPPPFHEEVLSSWQKVFDICLDRKRARRRKLGQTIQATFWTLKAEHVVSAIEFGGGRKSSKLPLPTNQHCV